MQIRAHCCTSSSAVTCHFTALCLQKSFLPSQSLVDNGLDLSASWREVPTSPAKLARSPLALATLLAETRASARANRLLRLLQRSRHNRYGLAGCLWLPCLPANGGLSRNGCTASGSVGALRLASHTCLQYHSAPASICTALLYEW